MKIELTCVYHGNCFDGMTAAWIVKKAMSRFPYSRSVNFVEAHYNDNTFKFLKSLPDQEILFVDFSLPREQLLELNEKHDVFVLDHHKTAQSALEGLPFCKFDLEESGATLAWKNFFPTLDIPRWVQYIRDRDLWRFELPYSKEVNAFIQSYPIKLEAYEEINNFFENEPFEYAIRNGEAILRYIDASVNRICDYCWEGMIDGHVVPMVMNNGILHSEIGNELCMRFPKAAFSVSIFHDGKKKVYSLRSIGNFDVSKIAAKFGGGGHFNAAGFVINEPINFE